MEELKNRANHDDIEPGESKNQENYDVTWRFVELGESKKRVIFSISLKQPMEESKNRANHDVTWRFVEPGESKNGAIFGISLKSAHGIACSIVEPSKEQGDCRYFTGTGIGSVDSRVK
ncbi:hypothetical protein AMTR_s00151p00089250 [Amborella trichopoda]|uniref:Uncharacterized protein n=1 Tax=Amborella trichopoda TaxID=13333 RepID=W1NIA0_AMBTC|nr:hypothetical protein AMTR_s00151p00089250 [Amborella trichopoda]